jgi:hypothetical protein
VDSRNAYWTNSGSGLSDGGSIASVALGGGKLVTLASGQNNPVQIAIDGAYVYWTNAGTYPNADGAVVKAPLSGGSPTTLAPNQDAPLGIAVDATSVYWTTNYGIMKLTPK